ncbi:MAG: PAS domain S-box protein [Euryarchaeota archaeon]|nr:PAS domain S-box protein [Euryarchaeota archaeon]
MGQPLRVLIIEDSKDDAELVALEIRRGGYDVAYERVDTPEGMRAALGKPWDAIVSDYVMPRFSGLDALNLLKGSGIDMPFIIVSGNIGEDTAVEAMRAGAHDYLLKGNLRRLPEALRRELREAEGRRARKKAEESLRLAEERYHGTLDDMLEGCQIIGFDWRYVYLNDAVARQGHKVKEELLGHTIMEIYPGIEKTEMFAALRRAMEKRTEERMENEFAFPDGSKGWFELLIQPVTDGIFIMSLDVTERKRAEAALRESEEKFREVFNNASDAILLYEVDGRGMPSRILEANDTMVMMFGYGKDRILSMSAHDIANLDTIVDRESMGDMLKELLARGFSTFEMRMLKKDGSVIDVEMSSHMFELRGKKVGLSILRDISERKKAENALKESEERHRRLFETMSQGAVYQNAEGKITSVNSAAMRILGLTLDQLAGRTTMDPRWKAIREDGTDFPSEDHPAMASLRTGKEARGEIMGVFNPLDNAYRWLLINAVPEFRPGEPKPCMVYTTFDDITVIKKTMDALRASQERFASLFNNISDMAFVYGLGEGNSPTNIIEANAAMCRALGYTRDELMERTPRQIAGPPGKEIALDAARGLAGGKAAAFEATLLAKDGREILVEVNSQAMKLHGKAVMLSMARDVTGKREAEAALLAQKVIESRYVLTKTMTDVVPLLMMQKPGAGGATAFLQEIMKRLDDAFYDRYFPSGKLDDTEAFGNNVCALLNDMGGSFESSRQGDRLLIEGSECPWHNEMARNPLLCMMTRGIIERFGTKALGQVRLAQDGSLIEGGKTCRFRLVRI